MAWTKCEKAETANDILQFFNLAFYLSFLLLIYLCEPGKTGIYVPISVPIYLSRNWDFLSMKVSIYLLKMPVNHCYFNMQDWNLFIRLPLVPKYHAKQQNILAQEICHHMYIIHPALDNHSAPPQTCLNKATYMTQLKWALYI